MYTGEWERVDATATHILWTKRGMNFACLCGNYMVIGDDPHTCKLCGREYQLYVALLVRKMTSSQWPASRPTIVCLCGSTRFYAEFQRAYFEETMAGKIVLSVGFYPHAEEQQRATWHRQDSDLMRHGETVGITPEQKEALDQLHLQKVAMADEVLILNVGKYVGPSTARELAYARKLGKRVRFLEQPE